MRVLLESEIRRMTAARKRFSQEFKDELCQEVIATSKPIREVAEAYGAGTETLRKWLNNYRHTHGGTETELTVSERARLKELEREVCDLRAEALFLKKATANSTGQRNTMMVSGGCAWQGLAVRGCRTRRNVSCGRGGKQASQSVKSRVRCISRQDQYSLS